MNWQFENQGCRLEWSADVMEPVKAMLDKAGKKETGGILVGRYSPDFTTAIVTSFSDAPKDSKAGFFWFLRGNHGLKKLLSTLWEQGLYYLGEWHFHPQAAPNPSGQDLKQMRKIARSDRYACPEPVLVIVGGGAQTFAIRTFIFPNKGADCYELMKKPWLSPAELREGA